MDTEPARERGVIAGHTVTLSDGHRVEADVLLWDTGHGLDLSSFVSPALASLRARDGLGTPGGQPHPTP